MKDGIDRDHVMAHFTSISTLQRDAMGFDNG